MNTQAVLRNRDALAYNTAGIGYDHQVEKQLEGCTLQARCISGHFLDSKVNNHTSRTLLTPGPEELAPNGIPCIWIGMLPKVANAHTSNSLKTAGVSGVLKKGQSIREGESSLLVQHDPFALRVVVILAHAQNKFYALIDEVKGLFQCRRVELEKIFFFSTFRDDDVTAREKRGEVWSKKITEFKSKLGKQPPQQKRSGYATQIAVQAKRNLTNQLQGLLATYLRDPREMYLKAMQKVVQQQDQDLQYRPLGCEAIMTLIDSKAEVTLDVAEAAIREMTTVWTALAELQIKPEEIQYLSQGLIQSGLTLEYSLIRVFVVSWVRTLRSGGVQDSNFGDVAKDVHQFARLACGGAPKQPTLSVQDNDFLAFLETTIENLRSLSSYSDEYIDAVTDSLGQDYSGQSLPEIFERFAHTPDVESAQQWIKEACRYMIMELTHRDEGVVKYLRELIDSLEAFRANLSESSEAIETGAMEMDA